MRSGIESIAFGWGKVHLSRRFWRRCLCVLGRRGGPSVGIWFMVAPMMGLVFWLGLFEE